ncbi:MAG: hypothetical protein WC889_08165 [Myxococcota bacterium]|jgi:hypothetical protein
MTINIDTIEMKGNKLFRYALAASLMLLMVLFDLGVNIPIVSTIYIAYSIISFRKKAGRYNIKYVLIALSCLVFSVSLSGKIYELRQNALKKGIIEKALSRYINENGKCPHDNDANIQELLGRYLVSIPIPNDGYRVSRRGYFYINNDCEVKLVWRGTP